MANADVSSRLGHLALRNCLERFFSLHILRMQDPTNPKLSKWPFFIADAFLLGAAYFVSLQPMGPWPLALLILCVGAGAVVCILPFVLEYRVAARLAESTVMSTALEQMRNLE